MSTLYLYSSIVTAIITGVYMLLAIERMQVRNFWTLAFWVVISKNDYKENGHKYRVIAAILGTITFVLIGLYNE